MQFYMKKYYDGSVYKDLFIIRDFEVHRVFF